MNEFQKIILWLFCFSILLGACVTLKPQDHKIKFYNLEYQPLSISGNLEPLPVALRIERLHVSPVFSTNRIICRDISFKQDSYVNHQWKSDPGAMVTYFLGRDLKASGLFKVVLSHESGSSFSHILEGSVDEFFEWHTQENWKGVLILSITFFSKSERDAQKKVLFHKTYSTSRPCREKDPGALAEAMSKAMQEISVEIIEDVYDALRER
ncbi:MAG: ABC-type transport auxiliary lipoprotein family protein [bacterium]